MIFTFYFFLFGIKKGTCSFSKRMTKEWVLFFFFKEQVTEQIPFYFKKERGIERIHFYKELDTHPPKIWKFRASVDPLHQATGRGSQKCERKQRNTPANIIITLCQVSVIRHKRTAHCTRLLDDDGTSTPIFVSV